MNDSHARVSSSSASAPALSARPTAANRSLPSASPVRIPILQGFQSFLCLPGAVLRCKGLGSRGFVAHLLRAHQRRERRCHTAQDLRLGSLVLRRLLDGIPVAQDIPRPVHGHIAEHMRMPQNHLAHNTVAYVVKVEGALLPSPAARETPPEAGHRPVPP